MDHRNKMVLQQHQKAIVQDLDIQYIIDELYSKDAISKDDYEQIWLLKSREDRVRFVITTLLQNGTNSSFEIFVDSLQKDYRWLWEKLSAEDMNKSVISNSVEDSLSKGDVPRLPDHYVSRVALENQVTEELKQLTRHRILVLHGMSGCGKTAVAIRVLRDNADLITNSFSGLVFWLNLGNCKTDDDIVAQQHKLKRKASAIYSQTSSINLSNSMTSIGSNTDSHSLSSYDLTSSELRDILKHQFENPGLKECLIVLDDVNERKYVDAFDIGCRLLITTRDTGVADDFMEHKTVITIKNNFEEKETLQLFASCLEVDVSELPPQAKKLHEACKGNTFNIALIGADMAENKESLVHDPSRRRWKEYLNKLEKKEFFFFPRHNGPMKTIEICVNSLEPSILYLYKKLAILPDNVKVTAKVISKLWNKEIREVEKIAKQLRRKSLIIEVYDKDQSTYIYEIHDLIMDYLRSCLGEEEKMRLHENFLKSYNYDSNNAPVDIVDDGYIAFYIGYHIKNTKNVANKRHLFRKLYLDLKFLGNKVRLTGPADVIMDLQNYEDYIATEEIDRNFIQAVKAYLSTYGSDLYRFPCTDIVQSILQHESKGVLYSKAAEQAKENCDKNELYFEFLHEKNVEEIKPSTIDVKEIITSVCFLGDNVLVGTKSGVIKIFYISTNKLKKELPGTGSPVLWVSACPLNPPRVASLSAEGVVQIFYMEDDALDDILEDTDETMNNNYPSIVTVQPRLGSFVNCRWANTEECLIAHTAKMVIRINPNGEMTKLYDNLDREQIMLCCVPCNDDRHVIVATFNVKYFVNVIDLRTNEKYEVYDNEEPVLNIVTVPGTEKFIILKEYEVVGHEFKLNPQLNFNLCSYTTIIKSALIKDHMLFVAMTVNKSGTLLFISTDDSRIICVDLRTNMYVFDLDNRRGNVISMDCSEVLYEFEPGPDVLLTGSGGTEHSAKVWYVDASFVAMNMHRNQKVRLTTTFDVSFINTLTPQTPSTATPSDSQINTPKRHQSFVNHKEVEKKLARKTLSLDRYALKPLNLKGICNGTSEEGVHPLLAVADDRNNIQIMRGRKVITEITGKSDDQITTVLISPCSQYVIYGLRSGSIKRYTLRTKETKVIMDLYDSVDYSKFVNPSLLIAASKNRSLMAYRLMEDGQWSSVMLERGNNTLGSQELLNDIHRIKKKNDIPNSNSETSLHSRDRVFSNGDNRGRLSKGCGLVEAFWINNVGLITVEFNGVVKLWNQELQLKSVLNVRQPDVHINCCAWEKSTLVLCDRDNRKFQTFELKDYDVMTLVCTVNKPLNNAATACALTADGNLLALGLDSGDLVLWNVPGKRLLKVLKHHKSKIQWCCFSPVPDRLFRSSSINNSMTLDDEQPPLVLVTMASQIVWWNVTYIIKNDPTRRRSGSVNAVTPLASPVDSGSHLSVAMNGLTLQPANNNFFFCDGPNSKECWKALWRKKTHKEGAKKKEILSCIKLSGMNAKRLCHDDKFSSFVTVDNSGHIHIMTIFKDT